MKKIFVSLMIVFAASAALASNGPNVSGGPQATENLVSKRKIQAIMDAITDVNEVIEGIQLDSGRQLYIVKVRSGQACSESLFRVQPDASGDPATFAASFVDLISAGPCY